MNIDADSYVFAHLETIKACLDKIDGDVPHEVEDLYKATKQEFEHLYGEFRVHVTKVQEANNE